MIAQEISHTAYDTMKEYMLTGAETKQPQSPTSSLLRYE